MNISDLIIKKRNGKKLSPGEIEYLVKGFNCGLIPDYQMSAFLMATYFKGMSDDETAYLTMSLASSGEMFDLSKIGGIIIDKHSSGGVGDKVSIVLAPLLAAAGLKVAKVSGRGLGFTGGTVDKLESIPGFKCYLEKDKFYYNLKHSKMAITEQTSELTPADRKIYALRNVTGTVESIPLIASSIMSKKIAVGAKYIILDVKTGSGAFLKKKEDAFKLAEIMVNIGNELNRKTLAAITDMTQPLGKAVGNALEIVEAVETLQGYGPPDLEKLCLSLGSLILVVTRLAFSEAEGEEKLYNILHNGSALEQFKKFISSQGGNASFVEEPRKLITAKECKPFSASKAGFVTGLNAELIGKAAIHLGAGRNSRIDVIDPAVGIVLQKKIGDRVEEGVPLCYIYSNSSEKTQVSCSLISDAFTIGDYKIKSPPLIHGIYPKKL